MSESVYVLNRDIGWGLSYLRVFGKTGDIRSALSNLLPINIWWANMSWNLRLCGSDYGGELLVRIKDIEVPVDPNWWTRTYIVPGACGVTPPSGAVFDETVSAYYLDFPPSIRQFTFTWQQTEDCVMYSKSYAADDPDLLNYVYEQGGVLPKKWPHR